MNYTLKCEWCLAIFKADSCNFALKIKMGNPVYVKCPNCLRSKIAWRIHSK